MIFKTMFGLLIVLMTCSCAQQTSKSVKQTGNNLNQHHNPKSGLKIEYGPNLGALDKYTAGDYIFITATITNDSIIPIDLQIAISEEYHFPDSCGDDRYKVFLLPEELTPDTATIYNSITDGLGKFLDRCLENPYALDKTLQPGDYAVITIGTLLPRPAKCSTAVLPRAVFLQGDDGKNFHECESKMAALPKGGNPDQSTNPQLTLGVKFVFYRGKSQPETCILHPCGQVSYPDN